MPDLMAHTFWRCANNTRARFPSSRDPKVMYEASSDGIDSYCTCPAFRYRNHCRHAQEMHDRACKWNEEWDSRGMEATPDATGEFRCPACGGPATSFTDMI